MQNQSDTKANTCLHFWAKGDNANGKMQNEQHHLDFCSLLNCKLRVRKYELNLKIASYFHILLIKNACLELVLQVTKHIKLINHFESVKHYLEKWMFFNLPPPFLMTLEIKSSKQHYD